MSRSSSSPSRASSASSARGSSSPITRHFSHISRPRASPATVRSRRSPCSTSPSDSRNGCAGASPSARSSRPACRAPSRSCSPRGPAQVLAALAPSTLLQLVPARQEALSAMAGLLGNIPAFGLDVGGPTDLIPPDDRTAARRAFMTDATANQTPLVSVIMAAYNAAEHIGEALESVLAQDWQPLEVVVVDDGSTDDTGAIVGRYPEVVYVRQDNQGPVRRPQRSRRALVRRVRRELRLRRPAAADEDRRPGPLSPGPSRGRRGLRETGVDQCARMDGAGQRLRRRRRDPALVRDVSPRRLLRARRIRHVVRPRRGHGPPRADARARDRVPGHSGDRALPPLPGFESDRRTRPSGAAPALAAGEARPRGASCGGRRRREAARERDDRRLQRGSVSRRGDRERVLPGLRAARADRGRRRLDGRHRRRRPQLRRG